VIPASYIGVFLTFYLFRLNFDQGGFASFVLLCGITINASIYILNEYNKIRERKPLMSPHRAYLKAWNTKIMPVFLTVISTILGFIPFMIGADREAFWFPLAAGTIGGLLLSVLGVFLYLPVFVLPKRDKPLIKHFRNVVKEDKKNIKIKARRLHIRLFIQFHRDFVGICLVVRNILINFTP
jgi:multidrug efflux pump subunit AcrB